MRQTRSKKERECQKYPRISTLNVVNEQLFPFSPAEIRMFTMERSRTSMGCISQTFRGAVVYLVYVLFHGSLLFSQ